MIFTHDHSLISPLVFLFLFFPHLSLFFLLPSLFFLFLFFPFPSLLLPHLFLYHLYFLSPLFLFFLSPWPLSFSPPPQILLPSTNRIKRQTQPRIPLNF